MPQVRSLAPTSMCAVCFSFRGSVVGDGSVGGFFAEWHCANVPQPNGPRSAATARSRLQAGELCLGPAVLVDAETERNGFLFDLRIQLGVFDSQAGLEPFFDALHAGLAALGCVNPLFRLAERPP